MLSSCSHELSLDKGEYLLNKQNFENNSKISTEELEGLIPVSQKPNSLMFNVVKVRLHWYNFGLNVFNENKHLKKLEQNSKDLLKLPQNYVDAKVERKKQRFVKRVNRAKENLEKKNAWFWRNIGEPPAIITNKQIEETTQKLEKYLILKGFRDAKVQSKLENLDNDKLNLAYIITENMPYTIDSVIYEIQNPAIDSLIKANEKEIKLKSGDLVDKSLIDAEVSRIDMLLKNQGYYNFNAKYINTYLGNHNDDFQAFKLNKKANVYLQINSPSKDMQHQKFTVDYVTFKGFDAFNANKVLKADTIFHNGIKYIVAEDRIPIKLLDKKITVRPNELFSLKDIVETQRQIGLLNQFSFANPQWKTLPNNKLGLEIYAPTYDRYTFNANFGGNLVQNILGGGFNGVVSARNLMRKLELLEAGARFALDGQPAYVQSSKLRDRYSFETGANLSVTFPAIVSPFRVSPKRSLQNPKTQLGIGYNNSIPIWGQRLNFKLTGNHSWQPSKYQTIILSFLDMNLVNTSYFLSRTEGKNFYDYLVAEQKNGNNLKVTYDPQFVSSFSGTYIYNTQSIQNQNQKSKFVRLFVESGGTLMNLFSNKDQIRLIENLVPLKASGDTQDSVRAYFRFIKINFDYRRYYRIDKISSWAYRINAGVANPYGKNRALPYEKNFFAGGSNSVRAWSQRSLGQGSAQPDITDSKTIIPQAGDILLESSIEYRRKIARFFGDIQFASFIDAGNIWKWYQVATPAKQDKANFALNRFYKEFAVGTGIGLRWDFTYFLFRLDCGVKVIDPSKPEGKRFVLDELRIRKGNDYRPHLNFGIGYPF